MTFLLKVRSSGESNDFILFVLVYIILTALCVLIILCTVNVAFNLKEIVTLVEMSQYT